MLALRPLTILSAVLISVGSALATDVRAAGASLLINGMVVFRLETPMGGKTPADRAKLLADHIGSVAYWGDIGCSSDGDDQLIELSGDQLLRVTPAEAKLHNMSPADLAKDWCSRLKKAMELPPLAVSDNYVRLPVGGSETVKVFGSESNRWSYSSTDPSVVELRKVSSTIHVRALAVGKTTVSVSSGASMENIEVEVKPVAAPFPQTLTVYVSGSPATTATVQGVLDRVVHNEIRKYPGAVVSCSDPVAASIPAGGIKTFTAHGIASSPDAYPTDGPVNITVKNVSLANRVDDSLWYSNDPETVRQPGPLFSDALAVGSGVRLLYHHANGTQEDMIVRVGVINDSDKPASVAIIPGDSKPEKDPVRAGYRAAAQYLRNWVYDSTEIVTIPAHEAMPISFRRLAPNEAMSGLCSLRLLDGPPSVTVRVDAIPLVTLDDRWTSALFSSEPWHEVGTHPINDFDRAPSEANDHVYPSPYRSDVLNYEVGGRQGYVRFGQDPIRQQNSDGSLDGNFGVLETISVSLRNPTSQSQDVELVFEASGGYAGGLFLLDGSLVKARLLGPKQEQRIAKYHLEPGALFRAKLVTLPISGGSYPATLLVRPILISAVTSQETHSANRT